MSFSYLDTAKLFSPRHCANLHSVFPLVFSFRFFSFSLPCIVSSRVYTLFYLFTSFVLVLVWKNLTLVCEPLAAEKRITKALISAGRMQKATLSAIKSFISSLMLLFAEYFLYMKCNIWSATCRTKVNNILQNDHYFIISSNSQLASKVGIHQISLISTFTAE